MAFVLDTGNIATAGESCKSSAGTLMRSSNSSWPELGKNLTLSMSGAAKTTPCFFVLGTQLLCFDLKLIGSPGCIYWNDGLINIGNVTDTTGVAKLTALIPANMPPGTVLAQWVAFDRAANVGGIATSDYQTIITGSR